MTWRRERQQEGGFALIELLVGLALLALAVALMPGALRLGARAWETRGDLERAGDIALALAMLERRIAEASPIYERDASGGVRLALSGDDRGLAFIAAAANGPSGAGVYRHRIETRALPVGGVALSMSLYDPKSGDGPAETRLLVQAPAMARLRYFGLQQVDGVARNQWHDAWSRTDAFPALVEIAIHATAEAGEAVRRITVAPRLDARP